MNSLVKRMLVWGAIALFFSACQSREEPVSELPPPDQRASGSKIFMELTQQQMELAGIEVGIPELRVISDVIECAALVEVPPQSLASVYSPVNGFVKSVSHLPGEYIRKGELLTTISHPDLVRLQRQFLESMSHLRGLELDFQRKKTLSEAEATSQRALEQAQSAYEIERARYRGLKAELDLIGISTKELEDNGTIQSILSIVAPVSGYITKVEINTGKLISPQDLLYEIIDDDHMHLELRVYAKDLGRIRKGQRVLATMPGSSTEYQATIYLLSKMIDPDTKTALLHGHFEGEPENVTPGSYMQARIFLDTEEMLAVPNTAVIREGEDSFIFVEKGATFEKISVELGRNDEAWVALPGLELPEGQRIVLKGAYYINGSMNADE